MRYASYQLDGTTWCGVVGPDGLHPLPAGLTGLDLVRSGLPAALDAGAAALRGPAVPLAAVRLLPPLRPPAVRDFVAFEEHVEGVVRSVSGGMNIYPAEIEAVLEQHPEIYDAAVFGIPSQDWGEAVHATVVRSPGSSLTGEEITAFAREHLASYKVPRSVEFTDELPRTGSGKLLKRQLRAPYWAGRTAQVG